MPPAKLGLIYGHTGLERFIDCVGVPRTKELFLTGRVFDGERAEEIGLVHEVHPAAEIEARVARARGADRRQRAAVAARQQARDRDALAVPAAQPEAGRRARRPARVVLRLRGLPRGRPRVRREARPRSGRGAEPVAERASEELAALDPAIARLIESVDVDARSTSASGRATEDRFLRPDPDHRRPAGLDRRGADRLGSGRRGVRRTADAGERRRRRRPRSGCAAPGSAAARRPT